MFPLVLYLGEHQLCDKTELEKVICRQCFRLLILSHKSHRERWYKSQHGLDKPSCATGFCHKKGSCAHIPAQGKPTWHPQTHLLPVHMYSGNQIKSSKCLYCRSGATVPGSNQLKNTALVRGHPEQQQTKILRDAARTKGNKTPPVCRATIIRSPQPFWEASFKLVQLGKRGLSSIVTFSLKPTQPSLTAACLTYLHFYTTLSCYFLPHLLPMITTHFLIRHCSLKLCSILFARNSV